MRVAIVQFEPEHGDREASMIKVETLLNKTFDGGSSSDSKIDLMVFPEMAFTGYLFRDREHISPHVEDISEEEKSKTFNFCARIAKRYRCGVCAGFPRKDAVTNEYFNSQMLVDPDGALLCVYDKHHLYEADETWASEGKGFKYVTLDWLKRNKDGKPVRAGLGICMDINPKAFKAPWDHYELARFNKEHSTDIIIFSSNWCVHPDDADQEPNAMSTLNYWVSRLQPLLKTKTYFLVSDRVGTEPNANLISNKRGNTRFCGSSCVLNLEKISLEACLDEYEEKVLLYDIDLQLQR